MSVWALVIAYLPFCSKQCCLFTFFLDDVLIYFIRSARQRRNEKNSLKNSFLSHSFLFLVYSIARLINRAFLMGGSVEVVR